jgi:hypothetical protein
LVAEIKKEHYDKIVLDSEPTVEELGKVGSYK